MVSWGDAVEGGQLTAEAVFQDEDAAEAEEEAEECAELELHVGRYTVLVMDEVLQRFKLRWVQGWSGCAGGLSFVSDGALKRYRSAVPEQEHAKSLIGMVWCARRKWAGLG